MTTLDVAAFAWPRTRLAEAIDVLAERAGLPRRGSSRPSPPEDLSAGGLRTWVQSACAGLGVESVPVGVPLSELDAFVRSSSPSLLRITPSGDGHGDGDASFLLLVACRRGRVRLLAPDLAEHRVSAAELGDAVTDVLGGSDPSVAKLLKRTPVSGARLFDSRRRLTSAWHASSFGEGILLRVAPEASLRDRVRDAGVLPWLLGYAVTYASESLLFILSWWILGRAALGGYLDWGWLAAWAMILFSMLPFRIGATWCHGRFAVAAGGFLKRYLLLGALKLSPDEVRHLGAGHHLSRVLESEAVESLALGAGFLSLAGAIELVFAFGVLGLGAGGMTHVLLLFVFAVSSAAIVWRYGRKRERWTRERLDMSRKLVEKMVGHRTRLAQQAPSEWHVDEDEALSSYLASSRSMDDTHAAIAVLPRVWLVVGLFGLAPLFVGGGASIGALAVSLGGLLLAHQALQKLVTGFTYLAGAFIALGEVKDLLAASQRPVLSGDPSLSSVAARGNGHTLVDVSDVSFHYGGRSTATLDGVDLAIRPGEELLLLGPSGSGKSTLVSLLTGLRRPDGGLVLLDGLDRQSLGMDGWTRRIASAPQFHENWILTETFAFNLLMGRRWPPTVEDLEQAESVCRELGLGPLLERMPAGMMQMVGETGWQLSHGERSRVFAARALLQDAELTILDESFGALDPENLARAIDCARKRSRTLLLVAHP